MTPRRRLRARYAPPPEARAPEAGAPAATEASAPHLPLTQVVPAVEEAIDLALAPDAQGSSGAIADTALPAAPEPAGAPTAVATIEVATAEAAIGATDAGEEADRESIAAGPVTDSRPRHRVSGFFLMFGLALVAFATGVMVFNSLVMPRLIHGIGQVEVPDVRNLTLDQAELALRSAGLQLSRDGERFDPGVPRGFVLTQDPAPGTSVRGRKRVSVVVSLGEEFSSVPELFGESQRTAEQLVRSAGLQLGAITLAPSDQVGEGLVVGSDPGPESVLPQGSIVSLLLSTGAGEETHVMPDLLGREVARVRRQLEALGFRVLAPPGAGSLGTIVVQRPAAGSRITRATPITLQAAGRMIR